MDDATFLRNFARRDRVVLLADGTAIPVPTSVLDDPSRAGATFRINLISPEGTESGDRRTFLPGTIDHRELPLPLLWQWQLGDGHKNAVVVGRIDYIERLPEGLGNARGVFDTGPWGREAERMVRAGMVRGVSGDYSSFSAQIVEKNDEKKGRITDDKISVDRSRLVAATIVAKPAFEGCYIEVLDDDDQIFPDGIIEGPGPVVVKAPPELMARIAQLEAEPIQLLASAAINRVNRYRLERERELAVARIRGQQNLVASWRPHLSTSFLSAKAKAQPRDAKGRWIEIGNSVRWRFGDHKIGGVKHGAGSKGDSAKGIPYVTGRVKAFDPQSGLFTIEPHDGSPEVQLSPKDIEVVKAVIPSSPDEAQKINSQLDDTTKKLLNDTSQKLGLPKLPDSYTAEPEKKGTWKFAPSDAPKPDAPKAEEPAATPEQELTDKILANTADMLEKAGLPVPDSVKGADVTPDTSNDKPGDTSLDLFPDKPKDPNAPPVAPEEMVQQASDQKKALSDAISASKSDDPQIKEVGLDRLSELLGVDIETPEDAAPKEQNHNGLIEDREELGRQLFNNLAAPGETWEKDGEKYMKAGDGLKKLQGSKLVSKKRKQWVENTYGQNAERIPTRKERDDAAWAETWKNRENNRDVTRIKSEDVAQPVPKSSLPAPDGTQPIPANAPKPTTEAWTPPSASDFKSGQVAKLRAGDYVRVKLEGKKGFTTVRVSEDHDPENPNELVVEGPDTNGPTPVYVPSILPISPVAPTKKPATAKAPAKPSKGSQSKAVHQLGGDIVKAQQAKNAKAKPDVSPTGPDDDPLAIHDANLAKGTQWNGKPAKPSADGIDIGEGTASDSKKVTVPQFGSSKSTKTVSTDAGDYEVDENGSYNLKKGQSISLTNPPKPIPTPQQKVKAAKEEAVKSGNLTVLAKTMFQNLHPDSNWDEANQDEWLDAAKKALEAKKNG